MNFVLLKKKKKQILLDSKYTVDEVPFEEFRRSNVFKLTHPERRTYFLQVYWFLFVDFNSFFVEIHFVFILNLKRLKMKQRKLLG